MFWWGMHGARVYTRLMLWGWLGACMWAFDCVAGTSCCWCSLHLLDFACFELCGASGLHGGLSDVLGLG